MSRSLVADTLQIHLLHGAFRNMSPTRPDEPVAAIYAASTFSS